MPQRRKKQGALPRVLFAAEIDPSGKFGSFEEQTFSLCRAFHERSGVFIPLYSSALGPKASAEYRAHGLRAESLDLGRFRLSTLARLVALVRGQKIEVVHWNFYEPIKNGYLWALSLLTPSVRHFFTDHISRSSTAGHPDGSYKSAGKRLLYRRFEKVFGVSDFVSNRLQEGGPWDNMSRWTLLVNTDRFIPSPSAREELRAAQGVGGRFVALVVAQLIPEKGVDVAIRAIRDLPDGAVLWVVGGGKDSDRLEALVRSLALEDRVRFFGVQWDVTPFMQAADCLVCPSLWAEAVGLVNIEALACGLPVVASRIGGIPEFVEDGRTGVLFTPGDHGQLTRAIDDLMADPQALRRMGAEARAAALEHFSILNRIEDYLAYYESTGGEREHADELHATA